MSDDQATTTAEDTALPIASARNVWSYARQLVRSAPGQFGAAVGLHVLAALVALGIPTVLGWIVDMIARAGRAPPGGLDRLVALIGLLLLLQTALTWLAAVRTYTLGENVLARVRESFVAHVLDLPLSVVERAGSGDLLARTTGDAEMVSNSVRRSAPQFFVNLVAIVVIFAGALWNSPLLMLGTVVTLPLLIPPVRWYARRAPAAFAAVLARLAELTTTVVETADGARTVETLRWERRRRARAEHGIDRVWRAQRRTLTLRSVLFPALDFLVFIPCLTTLLLGALLAGQGGISAGKVTTAVLLTQMLVTPVIELVRSLDELQLGRAALARLVGVEMVTPDRRRAGPAPAADPEAAEAPDDVRLRNVWFGYTDDIDILRGIDLTLRRGERLALVGPTGAGKSTLAGIIAGVHTPRSGSATVDGVQLTLIPHDRLRGRVVLVTQEHHVFAGTLADNLRMVAPDATDEQLEQSLATVGGGRWVAALPAGMNTRVGGRHEALSPAQAQQIALARLLLSAPATLVLDEATSTITPHAARDAERALAQVLEGRTVVAIAHRLHTAHDADRIGVVEDGRIIELGTHPELLAKGGAYARLWRAWQWDGDHRRGIVDHRAHGAR